MYQKIIEKKFFKFDNLSFKFRSKAKNQWDEFLDSLTFGPINYSNQELDYQELYRKGKRFKDIDFSLITFFKNNPVSIFSFTISEQDNKQSITSFGLPILSPLFIDKLDKKIRETITKIYYDILQEVALYCQIESWVSTSSFTTEKNLSFWHEFSLKKGDKAFLMDDGYINLKISLDEIDKLYRKRKLLSEIKKASNLWTISIKKKLDYSEWNNFKQLHISVSGKQTRSDKTWDSQYNDINNQKAFAIFLYDKSRLIGGTMYRYTKTNAVYAIGAYDRNLFPKPISHLSHYQAIGELKKKKVNWLRMGDIPRHNDYGEPSKKEISIGFFKKKFATDIFKKSYLIHKRKEKNERI